MIDNNPAGVPEGAVQRRGKSLQLRISGKSYRAIGRELGISECQAHHDVKAALEELHAQQLELAHVWQTQEQAKLDALEAAIMPRALAGDQPAIDRALKIQESRRRLLGIDQPMKIAPTDPSGENPYAASDDQQLRADLVKLVAAFTSGHGPAADPPVAGGGEASLDAVGTPESTPAAG